MKKFLFLFASMMLLGGYFVHAATTENANMATTENATEVVTLHNVDVYQWGSTTPDYNTTAWIQLAFGSESEVAPIVLRPESYVALDEIVVEGSGDYEYDFVVTGIPAW